MAQIKYVNDQGLKKVQEDYVAKIAEAVKDLIKNVTVQGQTAEVAGGTATVDLTSVLEPFAKKADLEQLVGHIALKGSTEKAQLETLKDTATVGDIYIVTDDNNDFYLFVGNEAVGAENGFIDLGSHLDIKIDEYLKKTDADDTYVKIETGVEQLKEKLDAAYVTNEKAETTYCKVEDGYTKETDFVAYTDQEIETALGIGAQFSNPRKGVLFLP